MPGIYFHDIEGKRVNFVSTLLHGEYLMYTAYLLKHTHLIFTYIQI